MASARRRVRVEGIVQGVGFRPFVYRLAQRLGLAGAVWNDSRGVLVEVEGPAGALDAFVGAVAAEAPPLAEVSAVRWEALEPTGQRGFSIAESQRQGARATLIAPDTATCDACLGEVLDPADRRFGYAFTNCTLCGPRLTIIRDVPYDRAATTMADFPLCADCRREYEDPADRRFHAEPVACPACGPRLALLDGQGAPVDGDPVAETARLLQRGRVVAIKGLGGYHLAALASDEAAVSALRQRKHREEKPLAVMVTDLESARALTQVDEAAARLLTGPRRPIVLLPRHPDAPLAASVAPANRELGVMLPYTPLHHLLARAVGAPFVLTSGNLSDEPIAYRDHDARSRLAAVADAFLTHDRAIHVRVDDSVVRPLPDGPMLLRRARGFAPSPLRLARPVARPILAVGAELKSAICLVRGAEAFVSHHIGDLEHEPAFSAFEEAIEHYQRIFDVRPGLLAHDLHPEYLSTRWAQARSDLPRLAVQHHHAHIASCLADNLREGPAIGVAFDGLGLGTDGTLWGGEFLIADARGFTRAGHLEAVPMPGGEAAIHEPWRMAAAYLDRAFEGAPPPLPLAERQAERWDLVRQMARTGLNSPRTSSAGRLFDAVAAALGVRDTVCYEGQAAVELEQRADPDERGTWELRPTFGTTGFTFAGAELLRRALADQAAGAPLATVAARFHNAMADLVLSGCQLARDQSGLDLVALSGGVWQNALLTHRATERLQAAGFEVLRHRRLPPNDGCISLGQALVAAASDRG
ncbi:MAG: carbamoyltransferase HypF [Deltaproteobacteria bacterium]|nr:carbamoyltransferase HypF [Deltaproteobacteria bacterium]